MKKITAITALTAVLLTAATATAAEGTLYEAECTGEAITAAVQFTDVNGSEWYATLLEKPVSFGVINGYEDGSFQADKSITAAEVATIFASTFENGVKEKYSYGGTSHWAAPFFAASSKALPYTMAEATNSSYADRPMTRAEVAYMAARYISGDSGELEQYIARANTGDVGSVANFSDAQNIATDDNGTLEQDIKIIDLGYIPSRLAGALSYCIDKGVFNGYEDNTVNPLGTIKRGEMLSVLQKMCQVTPSFTAGQFAYDASQEQASQPQQEVQQQTSKHHSSTDRAMPGDANYYDGHGETWDAYQSRANMTLNANDPSRPRAKAGDTFIAADGTSYTLEIGPSGVLGEGLPIATDLGRTDSLGNVLNDGDTPGSEEFGWVMSEVNTCGHEYIVYGRTGEAHFDVEWDMIAQGTRPQYDGTQGELSSDGYWVYNAGRWVFAPLNTNVLRALQ